MFDFSLAMVFPHTYYHPITDQFKFWIQTYQLFISDNLNSGCSLPIRGYVDFMGISGIVSFLHPICIVQSTCKCFSQSLVVTMPKYLRRRKIFRKCNLQLNFQRFDKKRDRETTILWFALEEILEVSPGFGNLSRSEFPSPRDLVSKFCHLQTSYVMTSR